MQNNPLHTSVQEAQPLVTFVVTYYDLPVPMLCECIDSILALSLTPEEREIIVVDDGSDTSPMNGLMQYGDDIVYVRQKNGGLSSARNKGIEVATGRYIQFVDADDCLVTEPYNHCISLLRQHTEADMILFDFTTTDATQQSFATPLATSGTELMRSQNIHGTAWGYLFRRKTLGELRFTQGIYHEDEEFTPQLLIRAERVLKTNAKAYAYHKRPSSITNADDDHTVKKRLDDCHAVIVRLNQQADRLPTDDRLAMQRRVAQLTMDYLYQVIRQTHSSQTLDQRVSQLYQEGLFPLPDRDYSQKYKWFRRMTNSSIGRAVLLHTLPLLKRER